MRKRVILSVAAIAAVAFAAIAATAGGARRGMVQATGGAQHPGAHSTATGPRVIPVTFRPHVPGDAGRIPDVTPPNWSDASPGGLLSGLSPYVDQHYIYQPGVFYDTPVDDDDWQSGGSDLTGHALSHFHKLLAAIPGGIPGPGFNFYSLALGSTETSSGGGSGGSNGGSGTGGGPTTNFAGTPPQFPPTGGDPQPPSYGGPAGSDPGNTAVPAAVPIAPTLPLLLSGIALLGLSGRKRRRA